MKNEKFVARPYDKADDEQLNMLASTHKSVRASFIEARVASYFNTVPAGHNDVTDFMIGYYSLDKGEGFVNACEDLGYFKEKEGELTYEGVKPYFCVSMGNGFTVEVKCSHNANFDIRPREGHWINPILDQQGQVESHALKGVYRSADFYLLIGLKSQDEIDELGGQLHPVDAIESIYVVPTVELEEATNDNGVNPHPPKYFVAPNKKNNKNKKKKKKKTSLKSKVSKNSLRDKNYHKSSGHWRFSAQNNPSFEKIAYELKIRVGLAFERCGTRVAERKKALDEGKRSLTLGCKTHSSL